MNYLKIVPSILLLAIGLCVGLSASAAEGLLANLEYRNLATKSGLAKLVNGEYHEPAAPGSASEITVKMTDLAAAASFGGIRVAAVVLVTETGGSGTFYDLALVTEQSGTAQNTDTVRLGDRIEVTSLSLGKGVITVDMLVAGPNDPAATPTKHEVRKYAIANQKLVPVKAAEARSTQASSPTLTDVEWQWRETKLADGSTLAPDDPSKYTIQLFGDGKVDARFDCNRGFGTYTVNGSTLSMTLSGGTTAECPEKTWGRDFVKQVHAAQSYVIKDNELALTLSGGKGTMKLVRGKGL